MIKVSQKFKILQPNPWDQTAEKIETEDKLSLLFDFIQNMMRDEESIYTSCNNQVKHYTSCEIRNWVFRHRARFPFIQ